MGSECHFMLILTRKQGMLYYFHMMFSMFITKIEPVLTLNTNMKHIDRNIHVSLCACTEGLGRIVCLWSSASLPPVDEYIFHDFGR